MPNPKPKAWLVQTREQQSRPSFPSTCSVFPVGPNMLHYHLIVTWHKPKLLATCVWNWISPYVLHFKTICLFSGSAPRVFGFSVQHRRVIHGTFFSLLAVRETALFITLPPCQLANYCFTWTEKLFSYERNVQSLNVLLCLFFFFLCFEMQLAKPSPSSASLHSVHSVDLQRRQPTKALCWPSSGKRARRARCTRVL